MIKPLYLPESGLVEWSPPDTLHTTRPPFSYSIHQHVGSSTAELAVRLSGSHRSRASLVDAGLVIRSEQLLRLFALLHR